MKTTTGAALLHALCDLRFEPGELAYLALTVKPEFQVRDRLAWRLYREGVGAAREWKRADLAVIKDGSPAAIIELKALQSWNAALRRYNPPFDQVVAADLAKARALAPDADLFELVVCVHVASPVPRELDGVVKYSSALRRVADKAQGDENLRQLLESFGRVEHVPLDEGEAFGLRVEVDAWLVAAS